MVCSGGRYPAPIKSNVKRGLFFKQCNPLHRPQRPRLKCCTICCRQLACQLLICYAFALLIPVISVKGAESSVLTDNGKDSDGDCEHHGKTIRESGRTNDSPGHIGASMHPQRSCVEIGDEGNEAENVVQPKETRQATARRKLLQSFETQQAISMVIMLKVSKQASIFISCLTFNERWPKHLAGYCLLFSELLQGRTNKT